MNILILKYKKLLKREDSQIGHPIEPTGMAVTMV